MKTYVLKYDVNFSWQSLEFKAEDNLEANLRFHTMRRSDLPENARHFYLFGASGLLGYWHG